MTIILGLDFRPDLGVGVVMTWTQIRIFVVPLRLTICLHMYSANACESISYIPTRSMYSVFCIVDT